METISLEKDKQKEFKKHVKSIKKGLQSKQIVVEENGNKKSSRKPVKAFKKARAAIYLGHIPHGFYENEMKSYFGQFGKVLSATVARSKKTGRSRGFGFVEFLDEDVAKIAAETMNNYLLFNRVLKCRYIPPEERKGLTLKKIDPSNYPRKRNQSRTLKRKNSDFGELTKEKYKRKAEKKIDQFKKFFEEKGIEFTLKTSTGGTNKNVGRTRQTQVSELGVLEIDESDNDIEFTTPPNVRKIIRKSCNSSILKRSESRLKKNQKSEKSISKCIDSSENVDRGNGSDTPKFRKNSQKLIEGRESVRKALKRKMGTVDVNLPKTERSREKLANLKNSGVKAKTSKQPKRTSIRNSLGSLKSKKLKGK